MKWDASTRIGRFLRLPLRLVPTGAVVPVLSGPLRGTRWIAGSMPHGAWLGTLERRKLFDFVQHIRPGMSIWDIGANAGLYTLASARAVGSHGSVYAFEPMQHNQQNLRRHLLLNGTRNVVVVPVAVAENTGKIRMAEGDSPSEFHIESQGSIEVLVVDLDSWFAENHPAPPDLVKIDVEGAEDAVLRGGARTFSEHQPVIYLCCMVSANVRNVRPCSSVGAITCRQWKKG